MCTGDGNDLAATQIIFTQPARTGCVAKTLIQHIFNGRVTTAQGIADYDQVRPVMHRLFSVALMQDNALIFKQGTHGWIGVLVGAGHLMTRATGKYGYATHKCSACSKYMDFHYFKILNLFKPL